MLIKRHTLTLALTIAAEQYAVDAKTSAEVPNCQRLVEQFERQALEAADIAIAIQTVDNITLED